MRLYITVTLFLMLMMPSFANSAQSNSRVVFEVENWVGKEHRSSDTGRFTRCSISIEYESGTDLMVSMNEGMELEVWLFNKSWELAEGAFYPIRLKVDQYQTAHGEAEVVVTYGVYIFIANGDWFFKLMQKGQGLHIYTQDDEMHFSLDGSKQALDKMKACTLNALQEQRRSGINTNPFDRDGSTKNIIKDKQDVALRPYTMVERDDMQTKAFALNVLMMQPLRHYTKIETSEKNDAMKKFPVAWRGPGAIGLITRLEGLGLERLASVLTQEKREACASQFDASKTDFVLRDGGKGKQLRFFCHDEDELAEVISLYPAKAGGYFMVGHYANDGAKAIKADRLFNMAANDLLRGY